MDRLSTSKTVFHKISLNVVDNGTCNGELGDDVALPDCDSDVDPVTADSGDDWDTDLEGDDNDKKQRFVRDDQTRQMYLAACRQLDLVPAHCFLKGVNTESINLNFQGFGPVGTRAVATAMVRDCVSTELLLAGNLIGRAGIRHICEMLKENDFLTHVDLSENGLGEYAAEHIADVFKHNDTLFNLKLSGNHFKDKDAEHFAAILSIGHYTGLRKLDLSHNTFGDIGAKILGQAIGDNETLVELDLSWNQIRADGIHDIAKGLEENNCLQVLDLSSNGVDTVGAGWLGKSLVSNRYLRGLNLNSNRIGIEGVKHLFTSLAKNETLKVLRLTNNPITFEGPLVALTLVRKSKTSVLEGLEIAGAHVSREFFTILEEIQKERPQFKVYFAGSRVTDKPVPKKKRNKLKNDPMFVFINFVENGNMKLVEMFKLLDTDKSCTMTREEFLSGLTKTGCPLDSGQFENVLDTLDVDKDGEIDIVEFMDAYAVQKRRFIKEQNAIDPVASASTRPTSSEVPG